MTRPWPRADDLTAPYWNAAAEGRILIQRCESCGTYQHPPHREVRCCSSPSPTWSECAGTGNVYSFIVDHRNMVPGFDEPYVVATVELDEAPADIRIVANIVDCEPSSVAIGTRVHAVFVPGPNGTTLPCFTPVDAA